jgi:hypothetical protein
MLALLLLAGGTLHGCAGRRLLHSVTIRPPVISPNADGQDDIAEIKYSLSRLSWVNIYLLDEAGQRHDLRVNERRSKGERTLYFGGVVDGSLLPDGSYTMVFEAMDARGRSERTEERISLVDGDPLPMRVENLHVWPQTFQPNRDGIADRVTIGYNLNKEAARVDVYILGPEGDRFPVPEDKIREPGAPGTHEHDYDGGIDLGATPPPDGEYTVVVVAYDAVGNRSEVRGALTIEGGGLPLVEIIQRAAVFNPAVVPLGDTLYFTCTVKNIGTVPIRTKGPEPGTVYSTSENYNTLAEYEEPGLFRVGLDYEGNTAGRMYPFRWQLGRDDELTVIDTVIGPQKYLMPGQTVTVWGGLRIEDAPVKTEPFYWIGLIHEHVWIVQDRVEPTQIAVGF